MENKSIKFFLSLQLIMCSMFFQQSIAADNPFQYHTYLGGIGGVGSTTWGGLVPTRENQNVAMSLSTPTQVTEGGVVWGVFGGYEFTPYFAIEANYMKYPDATVSFDPMSLFSFANNNLTEFTTQTETVAVMGKIMLIIPKANIRAFSSVGAAEVHRQDDIYNHWRLSPTFGVGLNYNFTPHFMGEFGGNYTAGYGEAQLNPTDVYFPFLYSVTLRFAYRV